jgi:hypothetical protein
MNERARLLEQGFVKIRATTDDGITETLWAKQTGDATDRFRLDNSPFFVYRMSDGDVVEGAFVSEGMYDFVRVVERSGNRTVRLLLSPEQADSQLSDSVLMRVAALGCGYEGFNKRLIAVSVPTSVSLEEIASFLAGTGLQWEYADPMYEDLFGHE